MPRRPLAAVGMRISQRRPSQHVHDDIDATSDRDEHHPQPGSTQAKPETSTGSEKLRETAKRFQIGRATERIKVISGKT
jgi:hypothetical protein